MSILSKFRQILTAYPITRGMLSYSLIWPFGNIVQQTIQGNSWDTYDWARVCRFALYGGFFVAPTLYCWVRISSQMFPAANIQSALAKAIIEQLSYTPFAMTCFYFFMSLMESNTIRESLAEVQTKFIPTYKVAMSVWPAVAFINFHFVPERNRVVVISCCSLLWTTFLSYMKILEKRQLIDAETGERISLFDSTATRTDNKQQLM